MNEIPRSEVTQLLVDWRNGNERALDQLMPIVYEELRRVAHRHMRGEAQNATLQATALVNEAYIRLVEMDIQWQGRVHFFAVAAGLMRRILVDEARRRRAQKRGGGERHLSIEDVDVAQRPAQDLLALDEALRKLAEFDARKSQVLELRFFAGLTIEETSAVLEVSHATVERDLKMARAWLTQQLREQETGED